ncbi:hypothetical protein JYT96_00830 [Gammaproteobacteria bacterium AH-315-C21]|nr:hypothetical protein [Gammaproteobacteria bacterium AH-315-C21]
MVFSLARGIFSVSQKDVVGQTVSKFRRGRFSGYSAGIAELITVAVGFYFNQASQATDSVDQYRIPIIALLWVAALLWVIAALLFSRLLEMPGATEGGKNAIASAIASFALIKTDSQLRLFVITRGLLISTALLVPFIVAVISAQSHAGARELEILIVASRFAGSLSSPIWGRLSDGSSCLILIVAGRIAGACGVLFSVLNVMDVSIHFYTYTVLFMVFVPAHAGVRIGCQTYLVDMAIKENRAAYVALSNIIIGAVLLMIGAISAITATYDTLFAILLLSVLALTGAISAFGLNEIH